MSLTDAKVAKELEAQKKRADALKFLDTKGQSVGAISLQKIEENKNKLDNTLALLFKEKAAKMSKTNVELNSKQALLKQQLDTRDQVAAKTINSISAPLQSGWKEVPDTVSGKSYYWNLATNETTWDRPICTDKLNASSSDTSATVDLPPNWIQTIHAGTKQIFYKNTVTGATSFTKPTNVIPSSSVGATLSTTIAASNSNSDNLTGQKVKLSSDTSNNGGNSSSSNKRNRTFDPLDPLRIQDGDSKTVGKMADSTVSGPLWQQRPYPAPSSIVKQKPTNGLASTVEIGPVFGSSAIRK